MDHLNKSENIGPTYHGEAERRKGGRTSDNSQDTTTKGACRKLDHYWTESEGISLTLAFNHNNNLQCIRTGHLHRLYSDDLPKLTPPNKICSRDIPRNW
jgi:hypothetical protein